MFDVSWTALLTFVGLVLSVSLYALAVSGHFPAEHRASTLRDSAGASILWGTLGAALVSAVYAVAFAVAALPWHAAIIAGGAALLAAPLLLRPFPDRFVNGRSALVTFAIASVTLAAFAWQSA